jgi:hypothetical protein
VKQINDKVNTNLSYNIDLDDTFMISSTLFLVEFKKTRLYEQKFQAMNNKSQVNLMLSILPLIFCCVNTHIYGWETGQLGYTNRSYIKFTFQQITFHHLDLYS